MNAPQLLDKSLWETSGHWGWYKEAMFAATSAGETTEDDQVFAIKPMNCPGHVQIFKHGLRSYRELPLRLAEFGNVHRYEPSGALHGLMRVRGFTQDDAHIFCTEDQMADECLKINDLILSTYKDFGFEEIVVKLSTRPEKRVGSDEAWDRAEDIMSKVLEQIAARLRRQDQDGGQSGRGRLLRPQVRICAARRDRPRLAVRHHAGGLQPAGTLRRLLHRCRRREEGAGDDPPRHLRLDGALPRHPDRAFRRPLPAVARADAGGGRDHHLGRRCLCAGSRATCCARRGFAPRPISATRRSTTRSANTRCSKVPVILVVGKREMEERAVNIRRLGSQNQTPMSLSGVVSSLTEEATPPDLQRD